ncbi:LacI family DNA-binding transcriptional regulator [Streptomyces canus]|uniref:LacI family DNA-binding transcriptional regulator n=1 Tax=Streptomyces canus TaxID=58343 RepID=UPI002252662A|nr:LacI family DNA-binding transcriptional regulator [Streptomyces canus]MCX5259686.1 LacI family DNA-binding transcriptional regulator [Streptomyces canus]
MHVTGHTSFDGQTAPSPGQRRPVGIRAVAQAAGVSCPTVSTVISGRPNVEEETRGRVEAAVRDRAFRRDATAFALAGGAAQAVTVLTSNPVLHGCPATPRGLEEASRSAGFALGVRVVTPEDDLGRTVAAAADTGGGLVVIGYDRLGAAVLDRVPARVPCAALVEAPPPDLPCGGRRPGDRPDRHRTPSRTRARNRALHGVPRSPLPAPRLDRNPCTASPRAEGRRRTARFLNRTATRPPAPDNRPRSRSRSTRPRAS